MSESKVYIFFDVTSSNINRIVLPIANRLAASKDNKVIVLLENLVVKREVHLNEFNENISFLSFRDLPDTVLRIKEKYFVNFGYRIADLYFTFKFKKLGFKALQIQHGMYQDFLKRSFLGYFSNMKKKIFYIQCIGFLFSRFNLVLALYLMNKDLLKSYKINDYIRRNRSKLHNVHSDKLFIWGEKWKDWFIENQFYDNSIESIVIGNPDYHKFIKTDSEMKKTKVCYIAQTFCEDGRLQKSEYLKYIRAISGKFNKNLYVKLHPRSNKGLYKDVLKNGGEIDYDFPISNTYIGHYSSVLALAFNMTKSSVYLLEINNEIIPKYFEENADIVFDTVNEFQTHDFSQEIEIKERNIVEYFENKEENSLDLILQGIN